MRIKWLHISDLHCNYENYDTKRMRNILIKYLKGLNLDLDYIFITGDIAYQDKGYTKVLNKFISDIAASTNVILDNIIITPGNHDLKRGGVRESVIKMIQNNSNPVKEFECLNKESMQQLQKGFTKFNKFHNDFLGRNYNDGQDHMVIKRENVKIVNINTCLVSGLINEEGKLLIGLPQLLNVFEEAKLEESSSFNIAIGHHGIGCLIPEEKEKFQNLLSDYKIHMYLSGHYHKAMIDLQSNNIEDCYHFTVGGHMCDGYSVPCFSVGEFDTEIGKTSIAYHRWFDNECWGEFSGLSRKAPNGVFQIDLSNRFNESTVMDNLNDSIEVDDDEFREFIVTFHEHIANSSWKEEFVLENTDIYDKFKNMKCTMTMEKEFDKLSAYFPLIHEIVDSSEFIDFDKKTILPEVLVSSYNKVLYNKNNGVEIFEAMVNDIFDQYKNRLKYSQSRLKRYIRVLVYWSIYECDIYNECK